MAEEEGRIKKEKNGISASDVLLSECLTYISF